MIINWGELCILAFCVSANSSQSPMREETQLEEVESQRGETKGFQGRHLLFKSCIPLDC